MSSDFVLAEIETIDPHIDDESKGDTTMATESESGGHLSRIRVHQLPVRKLGFKYVPAVPVDIAGMVDTLSNSASRTSRRAGPPGPLQDVHDRRIDRPRL